MKEAVRSLVALAIATHRVELLRAYLEGHREETRAVDLDLAAFVCVTSIAAITHTAVLHHPEMLANDATEALVQEATRLIVRYLQ
jgi:hypothetical protein